MPTFGNLTNQLQEDLETNLKIKSEAVHLAGEIARSWSRHHGAHLDTKDYREEFARFIQGSGLPEQGKNRAAWWTGYQARVVALAEAVEHGKAQVTGGNYEAARVDRIIERARESFTWCQDWVLPRPENGSASRKPRPV